MPVVEVNEGGFKDTLEQCRLEQGTSGLLMRAEKDELVKAIGEIDRPERYKAASVKRAEEFDTAIFLELIQETYSGQIAYMEHFH